MFKNLTVRNCGLSTCSLGISWVLLEIGFQAFPGTESELHKSPRGLVCIFFLEMTTMEVFILTDKIH